MIVNISSSGMTRTCELLISGWLTTIFLIFPFKTHTTSFHFFSVFLKMSTLFLTDYHYLCLTAQICIYFTYVVIVVLIGYFGRRHHKPYGFRRNPMSICCLCNVYLLSCYSVCTEREIKYVSTKSKILILRTGHMPHLLV